MSEETGPTAVCTNCDRELPEEKLFLHEAYCIRNIIRCPKCNEPIDKSEKDQHEEEVHRITACKHCKRDMENKLLAEHEEKCNAKPKLCPFCNCEVAGEEFSHHTYQCGSRTKKCIFCNKNILVRDYDDHEPVCQVNQQNYGSNFPAMQEEAKADIPKHEAPYSSISSKYVQNPSVNPYDVLTQGTKSKPKERPESKTSSSKPTHLPREEERKPTSVTTSTSHKLPEQKHTSITSKPLTSVKPDLNNYDKIGLTNNTKQSVSISHKPGVPDYSSHMRAPETTMTTAYTAQTSNYKPGVSDPRTHIANDKHALSSYLSNKHQEPGKHISSTSKPDITAKYTSGYSKPTDLPSHGVSRTGGVPTSSAYDGSKYGAGQLGTKPSIAESTKTSVKPGVSSLGSRVEPTSTKPTESRSHKPIFPEKTTSTSQNKPGAYVPITGTGISSKDITSYSTGISSKARTESKPSGPGVSESLSKKPTGGISGISGISGSRPSGLSGDHHLPKKTENVGRSTKPTDPTRRTQEDLDTQVARALESGYNKGTSKRNEQRSHQTQQHRSQQQQPSRNVQPNYEDYGHFGGGDDLGGEDAELQRAIQESYGNSRKGAPESRNKPSSRQPAPSQQNFGYEDYGVGGEDDELQKAIQESLKNSHPSNARSGPNDTWNDETFKRIMERSKHEK